MACDWARVLAVQTVGMQEMYTKHLYLAQEVIPMGDSTLDVLHFSFSYVNKSVLFTLGIFFTIYSF